MAILGTPVAYDPATAVTKATSALLAMTAFDVANARIAFTAPANGIVLVRIAAVIHGATTCPAVLFGVMSGSTVVKRQAPTLSWSGAQAATSLVKAEALFTVAGLSGSQTWDAAYSVETVVASSAIKFGGPNTATANDAFGALVFEVHSVS